MSVTKAQPKAGDKCPQCDGEFRHIRPATPEEYAAAIHRENPRTLPAFVDGADPKQIAELGELYVCRDCGYQTRIPATAQERADGELAAAGGRKVKAGKNSTGD